MIVRYPEIFSSDYRDRLIDSHDSDASAAGAIGKVVWRSMRRTAGQEKKKSEKERRSR